MKHRAIYIERHEVEFRGDHIRVGCTTVSHEVLKQIYARAFEDKSVPEHRDAWERAPVWQIRHPSPCCCLSIEELKLKPGDWRPIKSAPKDATWIMLRSAPGYSSSVLGPGERAECKGHWAQDLSGEEQPAFAGWYREKAPGDSCFYEVPFIPYEWRPL